MTWTSCTTAAVARLATQAASDGEGPVRTTFEFGRIQSNIDWILPAVVCIGLAFFVRMMYRRDAAELSLLTGWCLTLLRTAVFLGLLILYLQPQWRREREEVRNSRVAILVDTSLSMGHRDLGATRPTDTRQAQVIEALDSKGLLAALRQTHDVRVHQFSGSVDRDRVVSLAKNASPKDTTPKAPTVDGDRTVDWNSLLAPRGVETRLGQALQQVIGREAGPTLSALVLLTDGGQNAGIGPEAAIEAARTARVPIHAVGIGSADKPANVSVFDLVAPVRAYPGDDYVVTAYVQSENMQGRTVEVRLLSRPEDAATNDAAAETVEATQQLVLGEDSRVVPVKFELTPDTLGRRTLRFVVENSPGDSNPADNARETDVEIVDRKNRVLLFAGGPTREYRFLRTLLHRDASTTLDVLLQSAQSGISQDADRLLERFPLTREEMFEYDCVVAFDPDWSKLAAEQVDVLETWVAEQGGGMITVAGPVHASRGVTGWTAAEDMAKIRALYPVEFQRRFSVIEENTYLADEPWPLNLSRAGLEAEYLWLGDSAAGARDAWSAFEGVYGYCPVEGPKPGATVLARFADPRTAQAGELPVFFAEHFYGSGRVFYIASGEMWRLRRDDPAYFDRFYMKTIRHVSQGRLLRGSSRGVLLVGRDRYVLGNTVEVRAQLTDAQLDPLVMPRVMLDVIRPDATTQIVEMVPDATREGAFSGRFPVLTEGTYRLTLPIPESDGQSLSRRIQVDVPNLERENPRRNDALLSEIAEKTGGKYYAGIDRAFGTAEGFRPGADSLIAQLADRTTTEILALSPDRDWEEAWLLWMMCAICGLLCLEWLLRRLARLA